MQNKRYSRNENGLFQLKSIHPCNEYITLIVYTRSADCKLTCCIGKTSLEWINVPCVGGTISYLVSYTMCVDSNWYSQKWNQTNLLTITTLHSLQQGTWPVLFWGYFEPIHHLHLNKPFTRWKYFNLQRWCFYTTFQIFSHYVRRSCANL